MTHALEKYDRNYTVVEVLYDECEDGYYCPYCEPSWLSLTDSTYGGSRFTPQVFIRRLTLKTLRRVRCLVCDLPVGRCAD